jgi:hypothetical protein
LVKNKHSLTAETQADLRGKQRMIDEAFKPPIGMSEAGKAELKKHIPVQHTLVGANENVTKRVSKKPMARQLYEIGKKSKPYLAAGAAGLGALGVWKALQARKEKK